MNPFAKRSARVRNTAGWLRSGADHDRSQQLDGYLNDHPHIAVDMVAVQMQAALAVVRCQPVEPYTAPTDEPSVVAFAEVEQLRAKLLAKRHALYADNLSNAIADA